MFIAGAPWIVAVAATPEELGKGLMEVTDLGDLDGMLFIFDDEQACCFVMRNTLIPLEIAYFTAGGSLVEVQMMLPCAREPCITYSASAPYRFAVEAPPGRLGALPEGAKLRFE